MRCTEIKDRNGNFITIDYDTWGHITTIRDTLSRVVTFNYDGDHNLTSITQPWNIEGQLLTHTWASFEYVSINIVPNFTPGLQVNAPSTQTVLSKVWVYDGTRLSGTRYEFDYTNFGQVWRISHIAADGNPLARTSYNVPGSPLLGSSQQDDCPRFSERRDWVLWGVLDQSTEVTTRYEVYPNRTEVTMPDETIHKEFFATSGWQKGLTIKTEVWSGGQMKKQTIIDWTQDDLLLNYQKNPRVIETNVYDDVGNRRRTTIEYTSYSLPSEVREWGGAAGDQLLRRTQIDYIFTAEYISRRVIGLPLSKRVYDGGGALVSKISYAYDVDVQLDELRWAPMSRQRKRRLKVGFSPLRLVVNSGLWRSPIDLARRPIC